MFFLKTYKLYLFNINTEMYLQSDLGICGTKSDLIIEICNHLNCSTYISGPGALSYLEEDIFNMLREGGVEYGATTGRPRQCNWMDWNLISTDEYIQNS